MLREVEVRRLHLADVVCPAGHPRAGQRVPVYAFVVLHPRGVVLVDTGVGEGSPAIERLYQPTRRPLTGELAALGLTPPDVVAVVNTHLHFDHCGGNRLFPGTPIFVQAREQEAARRPLYTVRAWVDFPGARYEVVEGEAEVLPGVRLLPAPGHTLGHQAVLVEAPEGPVLVAGQAAESVAEVARGVPDAATLAGVEDPEAYGASLRRLRALGARVVHLSHDATVWRAERGDAGAH